MSNSPPSLLDGWIRDLNPSQLESYNIDGHCVVLAGPGSGKTRVLVARVARLLTQRARGPRGVACITYSHEAEREMRARLRELGLNPGKRLFVGTVHGFCLACVVAPFARLFCRDLDSDLAVAGKRQQNNAFQTAFADTGLQASGGAWRRKFDAYRRTVFSADNGSLHEEPELTRLVKRYEDILQEQGLLDFDGLVRLALELIRQQEFVRLALEARFPFMVIDEYQDLGYPLHIMARELMRHTQMEVFAVGDVDQSIYGFNGADPRNLLCLAKEPEVHRIDLNINYRSATEIIDGSLIALAPNESRNFVSARAGKIGKLCSLECPKGLNQQAEIIATKLLPSFQQQGTSWDQIAILYIDKLDAPSLKHALDVAGINYAGKGDRRYPRTPFTRWLEDIAAWCSLYPETRDRPRLGELHFEYSKICEQAGLLLNPSPLSARTLFFEALKSLATPDKPLGQWLVELDNSFNLKSLLRRRGSNLDDLEDWKAIEKQCVEDGALSKFRMDDFARCRGRPDTVTLTTLHSSKGLEFEVVIMPGLEQGRIPSFRVRTDEDMAEARRIFYVGMSRAKDSLYFLYSGWYKYGSGQIRSDGPSQFLKELEAETSLLTSGIL